jgi:hypothetical protein
LETRVREAEGEAAMLKARVEELVEEVEKGERGGREAGRVLRERVGELEGGGLKGAGGVERGLRERAEELEIKLEEGRKRVEELEGEREAWERERVVLENRVCELGRELEVAMGCKQRGEKAEGELAEELAKSKKEVRGPSIWGAGFGPLLSPRRASQCELQNCQIAKFQNSWQILRISSPIFLPPRDPAIPTSHS